MRICCISMASIVPVMGVVRRRERYLIAHMVRWSSFQGGGVPVCEAFRVLKEAVQLLYIHSPKKRCKFIQRYARVASFRSSWSRISTSTLVVKVR